MYQIVNIYKWYASKSTLVKVCASEQPYWCLRWMRMGEGAEGCVLMGKDLDSEGSVDIWPVCEMSSGQVIKSA